MSSLFSLKKLGDEAAAMQPYFLVTHMFFKDLFNSSNDIFAIAA